jgi:hypothetical protein
MGILFVAIGLFSIAGGAFDWNFFMEHSKAAFFTKILGSRTRARAFYIILGLGFIVFGILGLLGVIDFNS